MKKEKQQTKKKNKDDKSTLKTVWWIAWIILLLILMTFIVILVRASSFSTPEKNSIFLVPASPGIEVYDSMQVWSAESSIDLFDDHYYGTGYDITVQSSNGDKVIAPGTESEYTFNLKNTGNVAMDYTVSLDVDVLVDSVSVKTEQMPIGVRLRKYSGEYLLGDGKTWVSVASLNDYMSEGTLSVNNYAWYTLEWKWLYEEYILDENGNPIGPVGDEWDTFIGNLSSDNAVSLCVNISTSATPSTDFEAIGGIEQLFSDDESPIHRSKIGGKLRLWPVIFIIILIILMTLVYAMIRKGEKDEDENDTAQTDSEADNSQSKKDYAEQK